jgi:hypothetical protein
MIFFEDVVGRGHLNCIVDDQEIMLAFLIVPERVEPFAPSPEALTIAHFSESH